MPPWITSLSTTDWRLLLGPLLRRKRAHRQRVYFLSHSLAKRAIDDLVLLDTILVAKLGAHDNGLKMLTVAGHFNVFAGKIVLNVSFY